MLPVVTPAGTVVAMLVADHDVGIADVPLNFTALLPCSGSKLARCIVTAAPSGLVGGAAEVIVAVGTTVNATPLLETPPTVTVTFPVDAPAGTVVAMLVADHDV